MPEIVYYKISNRLNIMLFIFFIGLFSCAGLKIMDNGKLEHKGFTEEISFEDPLHLVILPVEINGETHRFLFDTGAPNVISVELQEKYRFKSVTKKTIRDSEGRVKKVNYININKVSLGEISFSNTVAFVTDLKANPVLDCLDLDGIIGSNLMRFCAWQVDYFNKKIILTDQPETLSYTSSYHEIPFRSNDQHAIKIDFKTPNAKITNLKIDYGSTGSIGVPNKIYQVLNERGDLSNPQTEVGYTQSGIFADFLVDTSESSVIQSGQFGDFIIGKTEIENGGKGLLGTTILKNYVVTMNWLNKTIGFDRIDSEIEFRRNPFGFSPVFYEGNTIVKSVIANGPASRAGLKPKMVIYSIDEYNLDGLEGFCEYVLRDKNQHETITVKAMEDGVLKTFEIKAVRE